MDCVLASNGRPASLFFISYGDSRLFSELSDVPLEGFLQPVIVEDGGVQRLRQAAQALERGLRDLANLCELDAQCGIGWEILSRAAQHGADRGEERAELVMQLACSGMQH